MKEKVLNTLRELGFITEERTPEAYEFQYEGHTFIYLYNEHDESFINIAMPAVLDFEDADDLTTYKAADKINASLKYIKAYRFADNLWLYYEREVISDEDLSEVLSHMIYRLDAGYDYMDKVLNGDDDDDDDNDDDDDGNDDANYDDDLDLDDIITLPIDNELEK